MTRYAIFKHFPLHRTPIIHLVIVTTFFAGLFTAEGSVAFSLSSPEKTGVAISGGSSYDPEPTFDFLQMSLCAIYDYEDIMPHPAPDPLKFKFELNAGGTDHPDTRLLTSFNFYAVYYLYALSAPTMTPYIEGGAGIVYSDFQVEGQGLRLNFNPQAGIGCEWQPHPDHTLFTAFHAYHISNGGLNSDNRGINGVLVQFGYYF
ncbi:acyloxyacyl hydrolase [Desulforhopalus singaporensis]|uniref:Lipid A 3-O-deacylase (PagL) n=1 Tax=Desulforhopalus singaporensis TaxID=91360 RepID=A0A1H0T533_9BACT|nr:acyloxyacyl hydrolase [Desulforhopalus singaporensis]SDP48668.1 Lipid A 3-O-deacylase (PagL) [Desulforhopalus singaporensis]